MNRLIKVYGHQRSGNNYLCGLLYKNFYNEMESAGGTMSRGKRRFILFGEEIRSQKFFHPYLNLFGSHNPEDVTKDSIYIIRRWEDVEKSLTKSNHTRLIIHDHVTHIYQSLRKRPYVVYYEDLKEDPEKVLREIQQHFCFNRLYKNFQVAIGYCGWPD